MLKRQSSGPKASRKKKKGNATYGFSSLDPVKDKKVAVEDIRVWSISTSERTGRVNASRRTLKHHHQLPQNLPEEPSPSKKPGVEATSDAEETGALADSESPATVGKQGPKRKRVRVVKENDSVSELLTLTYLSSPTFLDKDGAVAPAPLGLSRRVASS